MLTTLRIKNLALVTDLTLELQPGYNVITGETGAGKSILIGALNLVLGERADRTLVRDGAESCLVEAVFGLRGISAPLESFLEDNGLEPCEGGQLVLKRTFSLTGASRQFVNGSPATLSALAALGEWLVDVHGPHEHQSLLRPANQLSILDAFGGLEPEREAFARGARECVALEARKAGLIVDEQTYAQQLDLLRFQVGEIHAAGLQPGEDTRVEAEHRRASNAARLLQLSQATLELLSESEESMLNQAGVIGRTLQEWHRIDPGAEPLLAAHAQAVSALDELRTAVNRYVDKVEAEPGRLQQLEERLNLIHSLKRKYGATLPDVIRFGEEARRSLQDLEQRDAELARLKTEITKWTAELTRLGRDLSAKRRKVIPRLAKAVGKELADLGFKQSRFDVTLCSSAEAATSNQQPATSGFDTIEFQFAPNPGEPPRPLRAIASSGELARVMLALKTVLAAEDRVPVLIFDEVDANIGGETANAVGDKMRRIAAQRQVLCITHLPQVAAAAAAHYVVTKQIQAGRTISDVRLLQPAERVTELSRMLGGQTAAARKHAEALLGA
jgi:DNA repair protein RecN (Recombination protein N)